MLTADTHAHARTDGATLLDGALDELANTVLVQNLEGIHLQDLLLQICGQEAGDVVAGVTERHLRQVVRAEAEVLCLGGDAVGGQGSTRSLDHRTDLEVQTDAFLGEHLLSGGQDDALLLLQLVEDAYERNHDLGMGIQAFLLQLAGGAQDGAGLHGRDLGEGDAQTATTVTQHGVVLAQAGNALLDDLHVNAHLVGNNLLAGQIVGNELVERGIQQTDVDVHAVHGLEDSVEVLLLVRQQLGKSLLAALYAVGQNHLAHGDDLLVLEEHMLRTCQTDTLGTEVASDLCVVGSVGVRADLHLGVLVAEVHQNLEVTAQLGCLGGHLTSVYLTGGTVQRDEVALLVGDTLDLHGLGLVVDVDGTGAADAALTHTTGNDGSVARHTAAGGEDTLCTGHAGEVLGAGLDADHDDLVAVGAPLLSILGMEHNLTAGSTRAGGQTLGDDLGLAQSFLVEYGVQQLVELLGLAAQQGGLLVDEALAHQVHGNLNHGRTGALAVTCLQEPQLALLNGELHVLHVAVVLLQLVLKGVQLLVELGHGLLH